MAPVEKKLETLRLRLRRLAKKSGRSWRTIGLAMGYRETGAKPAVSRLLNHSRHYEPKLGTLIKFCDALNLTIHIR